MELFSVKWLSECQTTTTTTAATALATAEWKRDTEWKQASHREIYVLEIHNININFWQVLFCTKTDNSAWSMKCVFGMLLHLLFIPVPEKCVLMYPQAPNSHICIPCVCVYESARARTHNTHKILDFCRDNRLILGGRQTEREIFAANTHSNSSVECSKWEWLLCSFWQSSLMHAIYNPNHNMVFMRLDLAIAFCSNSN